MDTREDWMEGSQIVVLKKKVRGIGFGGGAVHGDKLGVFGLTGGVWAEGLGWASFTQVPH